MKNLHEEFICTLSNKYIIQLTLADPWFMLLAFLDAWYRYWLPGAEAKKVYCIDLIPYELQPQ